MKKWQIILMACFVLLVAACTNKEQTEKPVEQQPNQEEQVTQQNDIDYELLLHLQYLPPEVGTSMTLVQEEKLYNSWAEIFQFETIPEINFEKEEVLFITYYSNGCGAEFESLQQEEQTLIAKLNYPDGILKQQDISCTEIAIPHAFILKLPKTGATTGTLIDMNRTLIKQESLAP